jgi:hypothetical protein
MATQPQYAATPVVEVNQVTTADTSRTTLTTGVLVAAGPATAAGSGVGKRITRVTVCATATTTAGAIRFWISTDGGTTDRMIVERSVPAITVVTGTTPPFRVEITELVGLILPGTTGGNATNLYASTNNSETFNIVVESATL